MLDTSKYDGPYERLNKQPVTESQTAELARLSAENASQAERVKALERALEAVTTGWRTNNPNGYPPAYITLAENTLSALPEEK